MRSPSGEIGSSMEVTRLESRQIALNQSTNLYLGQYHLWHKHQNAYIRSVCAFPSGTYIYLYSTTSVGTWAVAIRLSTPTELYYPGEEMHNPAWVKCYIRSLTSKC